MFLQESLRTWATFAAAVVRREAIDEEEEEEAEVQIPSPGSIRIAELLVLSKST